MVCTLHFNHSTFGNISVVNIFHVFFYILILCVDVKKEIVHFTLSFCVSNGWIMMFQYSQEYLAGLCTSLEEKAKATDEVRTQLTCTIEHILYILVSRSWGKKETLSTLYLYTSVPDDSYCICRQFRSLFLYSLLYAMTVEHYWPPLFVDLLKNRQNFDEKKGGYIKKWSTALTCSLLFIFLAIMGSRKHESGHIKK